jgi:1-acyl-sn-glycerol-3-phosphate acyltransferase
MVKRFAEWLRKAFPWWIRHYNRLEVRGIENLPKKGSAIIAPNHSGGLDWDNFSLMSALDHFITSNPARKRIWLCYWDLWSVESQPFASWVQKFSPIPISLTGKGIPYKLVDKIVNKGELIAIMPEGHSAALYEGYRLWKFYPGVIKLHLHYEIPIIPTAMIGFVRTAPIFSNRYNPEKVPPWEKETMFPIALPKKLIIHFGKSIWFSSYFGRDVDKETLFRLSYQVRNKVKEMISKYRAGVKWDKPYGKKIRNNYKRQNE